MNKIAVHFIGIGGSGMLGLAEWCLLEGLTVTGSDLSADTDMIDRLRQLGAQIDGKQSGKFVASANLVVRSTAIQEHNLELKLATSLNKKILSRGNFLAEMSRHRFCVGISGSHGKSTTTALMGHALRTAWPAHVYLGAKSLNFASSFHWGNEQRLIAEVDESDGTFLDFQSDVTVLTGLSNDHQHHYGSKELLYDAFQTFLEKSSALKKPIVCLSDYEVRQFLEQRKLRSKLEMITYGSDPDCDVRYVNLRAYGPGSLFDLVVTAKNPSTSPLRIKDIYLPLVGKHNVSNCLASFAIATELHLPLEEVSKKLSSFAGIARRMELVASLGSVDLYSDYAHNPQKIAAILGTLCERYGPENVYCFFEPHRYTRIQAMWEEFIKALAICQNMYVLPFYTAGENPIHGINSESIADAISKAQVSCHKTITITPTSNVFSDILEEVAFRHQSNERITVVFVGAGKSHEFARLFAHVLGKFHEESHYKKGTTKTQADQKFK